MMNEPTFTTDTNQFTLVLCAANNVPAPNYEKDKFLIFHPVSDTSYIGLRGASYKGIVVTKDAAEQMLTIQETTITEANPNYSPSNHSHYNQPKREAKALVYGSKMTPFRQLVWTTLHCYLAPKLKAMLDEEKTEAVKALDEMLVSNIAPQVKATYKENFNCLANAMSLNMFQTYLKSSIALAHNNMVMSFQQVGISTNSLFSGAPLVVDPMTSAPL